MMKSTNKKVLMGGIKFLALALPLMFLAPYLMTLGFLNKTNATFYIFFPTGIIVGAAAVYFSFKGIQTIVSALFD